MRGSHMQFLFGILFQVLCCPFSNVTRTQNTRNCDERTFTFLTKRYNVGCWSGEGFRANGTRTRVVRKLSTTLYRFVGKVKVCWACFGTFDRN